MDMIMKKYRLYKTLFNYFLLMRGNQAPIFFKAFFFGLCGGLLHFFTKYWIVGLPLYAYGFYFFLFAMYDWIRFNVLKRPEPMPEHKKNQDWVQIMKERYSVRAYQRKHVTDEHERVVKQAIADEPENEGVRFCYVKKKLTLVMISDAMQNLVVVVPKKYTDQQIVQCGRSLFSILLKLYKEGMKACVVGGFTVKEVTKHLKGFDPEKEQIAVCIPFGYESKYVPYHARTTNKFCRTRKPIEKLFFENTYGNPLDIYKLDKKWLTVFDSARWVPSASNMQNTRIVKIDNKFHFYKQGVTHSIYQIYTRLNMGISMTAWKLSCEHVGIKGDFAQEDPEIKLPGKHVIYYYTFVIEE